MPFDASLPLPSGASTSAIQTTQQTALDAIKTAVEALDNAISGSEMQVDVITNPSDTTTTGIIDANGETVAKTVTNGEGTIAIQITGTWSGQINFEGTINGSDWVPVQTYSMSGTDSVNATTTNGVFITLASAFENIRARSVAWTSGSATVDINASVGSDAGALLMPLPSGTNAIGQVTANAGTNLNTSLLSLETTQTSVKTAVELIDDAIVADDATFTPATTKVMMAGFEFDDTTPDSVDEGDAGAARMSSRREIYNQIRDAAGNERGANVNASGQLAIAGPVTNAGTFVTQATLQTGDNVVGRVKLTDGTDVADILDLANSNPLTVALVDGDGTQITSIGGGTEYTEDAAAAANPIGKALNLIRDDARGGSLTTTDGDNVAARGTNAGELYVKHVDSIAVTHAALTELAAAIDTEVQVDIVGALPAGTNAIGKLAANSGVDIGDVDVLSIIPGTGATNLGKAEDAAHASGDVGVPALVVYNTAPAQSAGTVGDYSVPQNDSEGQLWTNPNKNMVYDTPAQVSVTSTAGNLVASTTGFREVIITVPIGAVTGIYINANGTATASHFLLEPGTTIVMKTAQAISAIRAGVSNVTTYITTSTAS